MKKTILLVIIFLGLMCFNVLETKADSLCGPAGSFDSNQPKTYESYATNFSGKLCVNAEPSPLPEFPDMGESINWTCYDASRQNPQLCYAKRNSNIQQHFCTGDVPENTIVCPGDDQDLAYDTSKYFAYDCSDDKRKCEYVCKEGYSRQNNDTCVLDEEVSAGEVDLVCEDGIIKANGWVQDPAEPGITYDFTVGFNDGKFGGECYTSRSFSSSDCFFKAANSGSSTIDIYVQKTHGGMEKTKIATKDVFCATSSNSFFEIDPNPIVLSGTLASCYIDNKTGNIRTSVRFVWDVGDNQDISNVQIRLGSADGKIITSGGAKGEYTTEQLEVSNHRGIRLYLTDAKTGEVLAFDTVRIDGTYCTIPRTNELGHCSAAESWVYEKQSILDNSSICPFDNAGVSRNDTENGKKLVSECTPTQKCEYICDEGYEFKQSDDTWYCVASDTPATSIVDSDPNDLCGPAGSSDPDNPLEYFADENRFRGDTCATGEPIPYNVVFPYETGMSVEWTCKDETGANSQKCYAHRNSGFFLCSGTLPEGATKCYLDDNGLATSQEWTTVGESSLNCTDEKKCEYYFPKIIPGSQCGTANGKAYEAEDTSYGDDTLCAKGNLIPDEPRFPTHGKTVKWKCSEKTNPNFWAALFSIGVTSCSASRKSPGIASGCGDASGSYSETATEFRSDEFCRKEWNFEPLSEEPVFPTEEGGSVKWTCEYSLLKRIFGGKSNVVCEAVRGEKTDTSTLIPCFGDVPTDGVKCPDGENGATTLKKWTLVGTSFKGCEEEGGCGYYIPQEELEDQNDLKNETKATGLIPDTGLDECLPGGKDCVGEDASYSINPMSFTKLDKEGKEISSADITTKWAVVRDNVTGLVWEAKTNDDSLHNGDNRYTLEEAYEYIEKLNEANFNGRNDWRLPTAKEFFYMKNFNGNVGGIRAELSKFYCYLYDKPILEDWYNKLYWTSSIHPVSNAPMWDRFTSMEFASASSSVSYYEKTKPKSHVIAVSGKNIELVFSDNGDETVTDSGSGLMWMKDNLTNVNVRKGIEACENLELAGYNDWRLPNAKELVSLYDLSQEEEPFMNPVFYDKDSGLKYDHYWSSTHSALWNVVGYVIRFKAPIMFQLYTTYSNSVRCVRGGK